ncbi:MAG: ATP synthase F1 subunit epsilon [Candidatus Nanoperiomorbaceae bacterium]
MEKLQLITLLGSKMNEEVYEVVLPTTTGEISVFPDHEALVTLAAPGAITVRRRRTDPDSALEFFATSGGIIEIANNVVRVLVDEADSGDDIVEEKTRAALAEALKLRDQATANNDLTELSNVQELINSHQIKLHVAELRRHARRLHN